MLRNWATFTVSLFSIFHRKKVGDVDLVGFFALCKLAGAQGINKRKQ
jgi:hypothetical protein